MANEPITGRADAVSRRHVLLGAAGTALSGLAGCLARGEDSGLDGEIRMDGSNTVLPHGAVVSEEFQWRNNRVVIPVRGSGTGAGFQRFCAGETHVQNASRPILEDERDLCGQHGIEYLELETALDGLAVIANPDNDWCESLTVEELAAIWESGSDVETWSDVRPDDPDFPDEEIELYGRDPASGTFDYFTEEITGEIGNIRSDYSASADTNVIVRGVRGSEYALGFGGAGYYYENEDELKLLGVDDGDGVVKPKRETIESGEYQPLTRPLYTYFRTDAFEREEVRAFARFYFEAIDGEATDAEIVEPGEELTWTQWAARRVGYYAIPDEQVRASAEKLEDAIAEERE
ncbi:MULTISPECIES: PstS family phosphate ABC transporter substrate-binding protein [Natrialba]|uniref:PstS family phosphate ABC transporter substrate-binding protein n=1 Tax=Natrialba swarupiae TaxID=2448032 RepID=A0A5D5AK89_9EURY|nr:MULTISPECIES: PstS family phosphate ABC transporter substrate-binding protein [Natrialba]MWV39720.1 phosphate ABC transporter substrate-binding protein PstS family protein [Natrialba sp. INN-245]TYT62179.1 PstS family phosphate ABC transporter substrate-binding protein [Natrialba swarupiae]